MKDFVFFVFGKYSHDSEIKVKIIESFKRNLETMRRTMLSNAYLKISRIKYAIGTMMYIVLNVESKY